VRTEVLLTILGMALVTYACRVSGVWAMRGLAPSTRMTAVLRHIPSTLLVSIAAPSALDAGTPGVLGLTAAAVVAFRTRSVLLAMIGGIGILLLGRLLLSGSY
jgi:branched chain amino acid efflux pump